MLSGKKIILGVSAGIAAYKAVELLRRLQKEGAEVRVCTTPDTQHFVGNATFAAISGHKVATSIFSKHQSASTWSEHIDWGEWADLMIIAPCTANTLAKIAHGLSDNMLTTTVLAARCPILICPTMDGEMYEAPAVQQNLTRIQDFGYYLLEPESGYLASGLEGKGRLPEYNQILDKAKTILGYKLQEAQKPLEGKRVLVTAGPTREHLDPVRFLSNPSSGKMGLAMAKAASELGAEVSLFVGPSVQTVDTSHTTNTSHFTSADQLFSLIKEKWEDIDILIMAAAVSDWKAKHILERKVKKDETVSFDFERTPDILAWAGENKKPHQRLIGFAMETEELMQNALQKLKRKNADWILANLLHQQGKSVFGSDTNEILAVGNTNSFALKGSKTEIALNFLKRISEEF